ncbi:colicin-like pore-forming protein [Orbus sturtevantii]|uniref:colicin-like pore-forming protein n=1 Tax=Orbus sturtevantii TaxID=3074109 RepID=UPI00370DB637
MSIAYYDEYGQPRSKDGFLVMTIDFRPDVSQDLSPYPNGILSDVIVNPKEYQNMPIFTLPPSYINQPRVGGKVALDKSKMPVVVPFASVYQSKNEIDNKIIKSKSIMVGDLTTVINDAKNVLNNISEPEIDDDMLDKVKKGKDAITALELAVGENNKLETEIVNKQKIADQRFDAFLARGDVKLTKFKHFIAEGKANAFDAALSSVMSVMRHIPSVWEVEVIKPNDEIAFLKNKQLELLNRVSIITDDIQKNTKIVHDYKVAEKQALEDAMHFTSDFYQQVFTSYGEKANLLAKELAENVKGKKIRNIDEAMKSFEKYKDVLNKKFSVKDRQAIANSLKSLKYDAIAKNFTMFGKAFGYFGKAMDIYELTDEFIKSTETNEWRPFFVKAETLAVSGAATFVAAFSFAILLGNPIGILGYAFIIAIMGMLVDEELVEDANNLIGL